MAATSCVYVQSETLCYVQNYFGKFPKSSLVQTIASFYREDEIAVAKGLLFEYVDKLEPKPDSLPRLMKRQGDNKKKADCDDILKLFAALDVAQLPLPKFVAADLMRVPSVVPGEVDVYTLAASMECMKKQMSSVLTRLSEVESRSVINEKGDAGIQSAVASAVVWPPLPSMATQPPVHVSYPTNVVKRTATTRGPGEEADLNVGETAKDSTSKKQGELPWQTAPGKKKRSGRQQVPIRVMGTREGGAERIKSVPRKEILAAYVGRLHTDTTAEELSNYLTDEGIKGVVCKKLLSKGSSKSFSTSAFYVTCCAESKDLFYSEQSWPEGVELRDWIYYN